MDHYYDLSNEIRQKYEDKQQMVHILQNQELRVRLKGLNHLVRLYNDKNDSRPSAGLYIIMVILGLIITLPFTAAVICGDTSVNVGVYILAVLVLIAAPVPVNIKNNNRIEKKLDRIYFLFQQKIDKFEAVVEELQQGT